MMGKLKTINEKVRELKFGLMELNMKEIGSKMQRGDKENS